MSGQRLSVRVLTTCIEVRVGDPALAALLRGLLTTYAPADCESQIGYDFVVATPCELRRDGALVHACRDPVDLIACFELDLYQQVINRCTDAWLLHAAGLCVGAKTVVIAGASGAGKTTMTLELLRRGATYVSDECVAITDDGVIGLCRGINPTADAPRVDLPAGATRGSYPMNTRGGRSHSRYVCPHPDAIVRDPRALGPLVLLHHDPGAPSGYLRMVAADALEQLWVHTYTRDQNTLVRAVAVLRTHAVYALTTSSVDGAAADLLAILERDDAEI